MAKAQIVRLKVKNFKSFKDIDVPLGPFSVIVGANASGKSNLIQVLKFMRDAVWDGLDNAISMQGGCENLRNFNLGNTEPTVIELELNCQSDWPIAIQVNKGAKRARLIGPRITNAQYRLNLVHKKKGKGLLTYDDHLMINFDLCRVKRKGEHATTDANSRICSGRVSIQSSLKKARSQIETECSDYPIVTTEKLFPPEIIKWLERRNREEYLPSSEYLAFLGLSSAIGGVAFFDFDPKHAKQGTPITGKTRLDNDASNLALVLKRISSDAQKRKKFLTLLKTIAPIVEDFNADEFRDKSILFKITEKYFKKMDLYSPFISDGTVNMIALIIALYFDARPVVVVEEPERNVHPHIIDRIVEMMTDASGDRQIITTTHNPVLVGTVEPDSVLLVKRDNEGFSQIEKPVDKEEVQELLRNEIGLGRLLEQNQLGALR